jgi:hypothetical protein
VYDDDMWIVEPGGRPGIKHKAFQGGGVLGVGFVQQLDGHKRVERDMPGLEHCRKATLP